MRKVGAEQGSKWGCHTSMHESHTAGWSSLHGESIPWQKIVKHTNKKAQIPPECVSQGADSHLFGFVFISYEVSKMTEKRQRHVRNSSAEHQVFKGTGLVVCPRLASQPCFVDFFPFSSYAL